VPTYEYACTACGHRLEAVQSFTDDPLTDCPECGAALRKVYSPVGIVLKGSGFYKTDSRAAAKSNGKSTDATKSDDTSKGGADTSKGGADTSKSDTDSSKSGTDTPKGGDSSKGGDSTSKEAKPAKPAASAASSG
jgi:putative FmdB family regulatory protein